MLDLTAIEARANAATPGPWESVTLLPAWYDKMGGHGESHWCVINGPPQVMPEYLLSRRAFERPEDGEFIAHAREDIPALIARVRELEAADTEVSRAGAALAERVRELERIIEESIGSGSELVVGQYILMREKLAYDEMGYTATAINGSHRPMFLQPHIGLWTAVAEAQRFSMTPVLAAKGAADA